jgi:methyltransferase (TIGR00027 family)
MSKSQQGTGAHVVDRVQDTASWVAMARALESERSDALFHDSLARRLAGPQGEVMVRNLSKAGGTWPIVVRTRLIDSFIDEALERGLDAVVNLAAGLDSRPYRMALPEELTWLEVDLADVIELKHRALESEKPRCRLERIAMDLANVAERRSFFVTTSKRFARTLVLTEGLLYYLPEATALELAQDLLCLRPQRWITDLHNSAVVKFIAERTGNALQGTAAMQFATTVGPSVFEPLGWKTLATKSVFKEAGRLKRLPFPLWLFARLPEKPYGTKDRPWTGVCVLEPAGAR